MGRLGILERVLGFLWHRIANPIKELQWRAAVHWQRFGYAKLSG